MQRTSKSELFVLTYPYTGGPLLAPLATRKPTSSCTCDEATFNAVSTSSLEQSHDCVISAFSHVIHVLAPDALGSSSSSSILQHLEKASFAEILLL
jgi:hypothetical protein